MLPKNIVFMSAHMDGNEELLTKEFLSDIRLTKSGIEQVKIANNFIKENLPDIKFTKLYCSSFIRAIETASYLTCFNPMEWIIHWGLIERDWGDMNNYTPEKKEPYERAFKIKERNPFEWRPYNGESMRDVTIRAQFFLNELENTVGINENVFIVCHEEIMQAFRMILEKKIPQDIYFEKNKCLDNCSMIHYTRGGEVNNLSSTYFDDYKICRYRILNPLKADIGKWKDIEQKKYSIEDLKKIYKNITNLTPHYNM